MPRLLAVLLLLPLVAHADWPQWRGRDRDGVAHDVKLPATWPVNAPKPAWTRTVGEGQSSPVLARGRVFVLGREGTTETCWCLDATSGKVLWQHGYEVDYKPADASAGTGPKSTPTVDGDRVYMLGVAGMFHCLAVKDGEVLWKHDLRKQFWGVAKDEWGDDADWPCCGAATAPLVHGKQVLLSVGGKKAGTVTAFDRVSGKVLWRSPVPDRSSYGSGLVAWLGGREQFVGFTGTRMVGLSPVDGSLLWAYPFPTQYEQTILTPVLYKDHVIFGGEEKPTVALKVSDKDGKVTTKTAWTNDRLKAYLTSPVRVEDHLYGLSKRGELVCVNLDDGKTAWAGGSFGNFGTLTAAGADLLLVTRTGEMHVIAANPAKLVRKGKWTLSRNAPVWSYPALSGRSLLIKDKTDVIAYELPRE